MMSWEQYRTGLLYLRCCCLIHFHLSLVKTSCNLPQIMELVFGFFVRISEKNPPSKIEGRCVV